jgi:hypothetical protein
LQVKLGGFPVFWLVKSLDAISADFWWVARVIKLFQHLQVTRFPQGTPCLVLILSVLAGCGKVESVDSKDVENVQVVEQSVQSPEEKVILRKEVEEENRCLGLVSAVVETSDELLKAKLKEHGLEKIDRIVAVNMLSRVGSLEISSGLSEGEVVEIVERSRVSISTEADVETYAPQVQACLAHDAAERMSEGP